MPSNLRVQSSEFIDETIRISFKFNGKTYHGFKGDTLASALLANDIHLVGRSFKYHRPRGIMTAGSEEPNAIVQVNDSTDRTEPNVRATEVEIYEGLEASSQNCWPSVNFMWFVFSNCMGKNISTSWGSFKSTSSPTTIKIQSFNRSLT